MRNYLFLNLLFIVTTHLSAQADNEIQVYASPTIENKWTIFELHTNYTFKGSKLLAHPRDAKWLNETLEITHGFGNNFEIGFYTFTGISPDGRFQYLGNQLRPRITVPENWKWGWGASLSVEFGFFRPADTSSFYWQGEIRPILDKTVGNWYISFNPNLAFALSGPEKGAAFTPQLKTVYTINKKYGVGFEYYGELGTGQEHLLGPMIDLYLHPMWELNAGFLFGLTERSNQRIFKLLLGRRIKNK